MKCQESDVRMSRLFVIIAAIAFLMAVTVLATEIIDLKNRRPVFDQLDVPTGSYLVHRLDRSDLFEKPRLRPAPIGRQRAKYPDDYYPGRTARDVPDRLDGILMDDRQRFEAICRTV